MAFRVRNECARALGQAIAIQLVSNTFGIVLDINHRKGAVLEIFSPRQTNMSLFVQMHEKGFSVADIRRLQHCYSTACGMFNGRYRKTGRPFICHAVGVASSVAHFSRDPDMVIAGLFHAAYDAGQFPDGRYGKTTREHRDWLSGKIGSKAEAIAARYLDFEFETGAPERLLSEGFHDCDRDLLLIALAHEVDDLADGGLALAPKYGDSIAWRVTSCTELARQIGQHDLAECLAAHGRRHEDLVWMHELQPDRLRGFRIVAGLRAYFRLRRAAARGKDVRVF